MTWKRSKDGGIDYDVSQEFEQEFNPFGSAHTMTFNINDAPLPPQKSRKQELRDKINAMRRAKMR